MTVGIVLVSHVAQLAAGVRTLAAQMAPDVPIAVAGGTDEGGVGTSVDLVLAGIAEADGGDGAVVLYDLGSAQLTAELAWETLADEQRDRVRLVGAPLVEGAVAAAATAQAGADLDAVSVAASGAGVVASETAKVSDAAEVSVRAVLPNPLGLHARPAAQIVRALAGVDAEVRIGAPDRGGRDADARSILGAVALGLRGGDRIEVRGSGPDARRAVDVVVALVEEGFGERADASAEPAVAGRGDHGDGVLNGRAGSPGVAVGVVRHLRTGDPDIPDRPGGDIDVEQARLMSAVAQVDTDLARRTDTPGAEGLAAAHRAMLADPALRDLAMAEIGAGLAAEPAWWRAVRGARDTLAATDAPAADRAADVTEVGRAVLAALGFDVGSPVDPGGSLAGAVVVADELTPGQVSALVDAEAVAVVSAHGGPTAHASILARGFGLPLVVGLGAGTERLVEGTTVVVDAGSGTVRPHPEPAEIDRARAEAAEQRRVQARTREAARGPVVGPDGRRVLVSANVATAADVRVALDAGADGVGLLRTEVGYLERATVPSEDEQVAELSAVLRALQDTPVVVRTLDVGGDKPMVSLALDPARHGMLGERGLRYTRAHPELLRTQLRAVLRAGAAYAGELGVMAPMVTEPAEAREFRSAVHAAAAELEADGVAYAKQPRVGVMVEVPAAAFAAEELCAAVDFVSVGSNDLAQYVLAADRTNDAVAYLHRPDHPAVWRLLELVLAGARTVRCPVAVCGEVAGEPKLAARLVELGVTELSMAPAAIPAVRAHLRARFG